MRIMTSMLVRWLAAVGLAITAPWAAAIDCGKDDFKQARTMADLPASIRSIVERRGAVADPGARWVATDVVEKEDMGLPSRRLVMAAVGRHHAFVEVVIGGGPWMSQGWRFERDDGPWRGGPLGTDDAPVAFGEPRTLPQLLYAACDGYPKPFMGTPDAVSGVITSRGNIDLTVSDEGGSTTYRLVRGSHAIRFFQSDRPVPAFGRQALRDRLARARAGMAPTDATYPMIAEYLKALDADVPEHASRQAPPPRVMIATRPLSKCPSGRTSLEVRPVRGAPPRQCSCQQLPRRWVR